jgi:hypothetical protein
VSLSLPCRATTVSLRRRHGFDEFEVLLLAPSFDEFEVLLLAPSGSITSTPQGSSGGMILL